MQVRRVVTGQEANGRSVVAGDKLVDPLTVALFPGAEFHQIWGDDLRPALPSDGTPPSPPTHFPPSEGYRFGMFTMAPPRHTPAIPRRTPRATASFRTVHAIAGATPLPSRA
jgi:hypothetical protein